MKAGLNSRHDFRLAARVFLRFSQVRGGQKNRHFLMMETHHFYRKNAKIFLAVAPTSG